MKRSFFYLATLFCISSGFCQIPLTVLPSGGNKKASVSERIGLMDVVIHYDRPGVKGREGKIWGQLIPIGFTDPGFGNSKAAPWRAGANENTTIEFSKDAKIEGKTLAAGRYGFFIAYGMNESTLIFSKNSNSWGSFYYNDKEDVLRVNVKNVPLEQSVEWLRYEFINQSENSATVGLQWEKLMIPFKIETDYVQDQLESFRNELRSSRGFIWESWNQAAQWCLQKEVNLEEALLWSDSATSPNFGGEQSFIAFSTKAGILEKLGRKDEADAIMKKALPFASMIQVHTYGRSLITLKKPNEALAVFKKNAEKYPNQFTTLMGLARGYSANGNYKKALSYAEKALPLSPASQKSNVEMVVGKLKEGKDIN